MQIESSEAYRERLMERFNEAQARALGIELPPKDVPGAPQTPPYALSAAYLVGTSDAGKRDTTESSGQPDENELLRLAVRGY